MGPGACDLARRVPPGKGKHHSLPERRARSGVGALRLGHPRLPHHGSELGGRDGVPGSERQCLALRMDDRAYDSLPARAERGRTVAPGSRPRHGGVGGRIRQWLGSGRPRGRRNSRAHLYRPVRRVDQRGSALARGADSMALGGDQELCPGRGCHGRRPRRLRAEGSDSEGMEEWPAQWCLLAATLRAPSGAGRLDRRPGRARGLSGVAGPGHEP